MKFQTTVSLVLVPPMSAPPDGAMERRLSPFLQLLEAGIQAACMEWWKSVPRDAPSFQLLITASVIGEQQTKESSTSTEPLGTSSPTVQDQPASSKSQFGQKQLVSTGRRVTQSQSFYPTRPPGEKHEFVGNLLRNCLECDMPLTASQHYEFDASGARLIGQEKWDQVEEV